MRVRWMVERALPLLMLAQLALAVWYICMVAAWIGVSAFLGRLEAIPIASVISELAGWLVKTDSLVQRYGSAISL